MACLGIRCGGNQSFIRKSRFLNDRSTDQISEFNRSLAISNRAVKAPLLRISASTATLSNRSVSVSSSDKVVKEDYDRIENSPMVSEKLDEWMRDSVTDIVKNLTQAPLLVQIYANANGSTKVKTEKAVAEDWANVMRERPSPDGIILVEELEEKKDLDLELEESEEEDGTRAWGVLIQGKGGERECGSACYLLKTSRVGGGGGLGLLCTHFCLMKVQSFRKSAFSQLSDCWLLQ